MLLGKVMAEAAMRIDKYVTWLPAYGAEVRGGTAYCMLVISDTEIGSPYIDKADTLIIMNGPSLRKFKERIKNKGLLIVNSSLAGRIKDTNKKIRILRCPFTDMAVKLGNIRVANMIALGCFIQQKNIVDSARILKAIQAIAPEDKRDLIEINQKAVLEGAKLK